MKCLGKNVVLAIGETKDTSDGGIILPENARQLEDEYIVVMAGPDVKNVAVGDVVLKPEVTILASKRGKDHDLVVGGKKCIVVEEDDIRVVLKEAAIPCQGLELAEQQKFDYLCSGSRLTAVFDRNDMVLDGVVFTHDDIQRISVSHGRDSISNYADVLSWRESGCAPVRRTS